jgi:hypothetical protein
LLQEVTPQTVDVAPDVVYTFSPMRPINNPTLYPAAMTPLSPTGREPSPFTPGIYPTRLQPSKSGGRDLLIGKKEPKGEEGEGGAQT